MADLWQTYGRPMADRWQTYGRPLADLWQTYGRPMGIYIPPWWKVVSREGIQTRTNFSFRGRNFHFPRSDSCLPSEARLDSLIKEREKFSQGKKSVRDCNFLPRIRFPSMGDTFSSKFWTCSTISHKSSLWMPLSRTSFMDAPYYRVLQVAHAYFMIENFAASMSDL